MRSHPYAAAPPLPPLPDDLATDLSSIIPAREPRRQHARRRSSAPDIPLSDLDPDTSCLLSPAAATATATAASRRLSHHHVRVQGRLALVRSVSTVSVRRRGSPGASGRTSGDSSVPPVPPVARYESAVGSAVGVAAGSGRKTGRRTGRRRRRSLDLGERYREGKSESESEEDERRRRETVSRDMQLRGYGIGGAGNIRRPIDVVHFTPSATTNRMSMLLFSNVPPGSPTSLTSPERKKWNLREIFRLDRRPQGKASS
ncbi:hypothetical protein GE09DRAFT_1250695 [Coniochaeta sp. 2T2.1]|nr:hypothetical protein GE09DRAFT_1250695 [Coniochaeta sp. 2T2.1]